MFHWPSIYIYTDTFDSYRVIETDDGGITKHERVKVLEGIECKVYNNPTPDIQMGETAAMSNGNNTLCCDVDVDIKAGDEIIVHRSSRIRDLPVSNDRYFAGRPNIYVMPFGGVMCDIEHMQVALFNEQRVD